AMAPVAPAGLARGVSPRGLAVVLEDRAEAAAPQEWRDPSPPRPPTTSIGSSMAAAAAAAGLRAPAGLARADSPDGAKPQAARSGAVPGAEAARPDCLVRGVQAPPGRPPQAQGIMPRRCP